MPTYEYHCKSCNHQLEVTQKITAEPLRECPECSKLALQRGPGGGLGLHFQGSGFYINDYGPGKASSGGEQAPSPKSSGCGQACGCAKTH